MFPCSSSSHSHQSVALKHKCRSQCERTNDQRLRSLSTITELQFQFVISAVMLQQRFGLWCTVGLQNVFLNQCTYHSNSTSCHVWIQSIHLPSLRNYITLIFKHMMLHTREVKNILKGEKKMQGIDFKCRTLNRLCFSDIHIKSSEEQEQFMTMKFTHESENLQNVLFIHKLVCVIECLKSNK